MKSIGPSALKRKSCEIVSAPSLQVGLSGPREKFFAWGAALKCSAGAWGEICNVTATGVSTSKIRASRRSITSSHRASASERSRKWRSVMSAVVSATSFVCGGCRTNVWPLRVTPKVPFVSASTELSSRKSAGTSCQPRLWAADVGK